MTLLSLSLFECRAACRTSSITPIKTVSNQEVKGFKFHIKNCRVCVHYYTDSETSFIELDTDARQYLVLTFCSVVLQLGFGCNVLYYATKILQTHILEMGVWPSIAYLLRRPRLGMGTAN